MHKIKCRISFNVAPNNNYGKKLVNNNNLNAVFKSFHYFSTSSLKICHQCLDNIKFVHESSKSHSIYLIRKTASEKKLLCEANGKH